TKSRQSSEFDNDGTWAFTTETRTGFKQKTFQQAVDYSINAIKNVDFIVGGFFYRDKLVGLRDGVAVTIFAGPNRGIIFNSFAEQTTKSWAVYADAVWHVSDVLSINLGGRYSHDSKENFSLQRLANGTIINFGPWHAQDSWSKFTPR